MASATIECPRCGTDVAPSMLSCPQCHWLVHGERLSELSQSAEAAIANGDGATGLAKWKEALALLPPGSKQHALIQKRVAELDKSPPTAAEEPPEGGWVKRGGVFAGAALLVWKIKPVLAFVLTKGKFLLLGLTKASTFFSMFLALGVYWAAWGWKFALGLVVSIYIHEIGHVAALSRLGIKASAPLFLPGIGAVVRLKEYPKTPGDDARVGLAGPWWGMMAAILAYAVGALTGWESFKAIARIGALINMFNLIPVWQLDGARGFRGLTKTHRWYVVAAIGATYFFVGDGILLLVLLVAGARTLFSREAPETPDNPVLIQFIVLVLGLGLLMGVQPVVP